MLFGDADAAVHKKFNNGAEQEPEHAQRGPEMC